MDPEWSPRGVAQDALDYLDRRAVEQAKEKERARREEEAEASGITYVPADDVLATPSKSGSALVATGRRCVSDAVQEQRLSGYRGLGSCGVHGAAVCVRGTGRD